MNVPPYLVFTDNVLVEFARGRPSTANAMRRVSGVGDKKLNEFGADFLAAIINYSREHDLPLDVPAPRGEAKPVKISLNPSPRKQLAFQLFAEQASFEDVMHQTGVGRRSVADYLVEFIAIERPKSIRAWVSEQDEQRIRVAADEHGTERLKPIFEALNSEVGYDVIRIAVAFMTSR